jgi:hypothetical protein
VSVVELNVNDMPDLAVFRSKPAGTAVIMLAVIATFVAPLRCN